jgi:serine/threonine protein kinase
MERLDGAPLDAVLRVRGALAPRLALDIVVQISRGLELAHAKGIIHRDLKPANVFLHRLGSGAIEPKVLDFGISKVVGTKSPEIALTNTAAILGSPIYMSPEQMSSETGLDARSDVHALGVLLWELLTGDAPFAATSYNLLVVEIMRGPRPKLRDVMPSASRALATILDRAFAIERSDRFASAAKLADALDTELTVLGGGVLGGRTAAVDVLGGLDLSSNAPPPMHSTTTEPLSVDPASFLSPSSHSAQSADRAGRASATSFADTQVATIAESAPRAPPVGAVSALNDSPRGPRERKSSTPFRVGIGIAGPGPRHAPRPSAPSGTPPPAPTAARPRIDQSGL